jgi:hypothetical protein
MLRGWQGGCRFAFLTVPRCLHLKLFDEVLAQHSAKPGRCAGTVWFSTVGPVAYHRACLLGKASADCLSRAKDSTDSERHDDLNEML